MNQDIDAALQGWEYKPGVVQARMVQAADSRQVIQMRVDLGILQIETSDRPDGTRPHGLPTYADYLNQQARLAAKANREFVLSEEQCMEADREFLQYYQRRICWLALRQYGRAVKDADHTLSLMDFVREHSPNEEYTQAHEHYRNFVIFHRTQAAAFLALEKDDAEGAIDAIHAGLEKMRPQFEGFESEEGGGMDEDGMVQHLRKMEDTLRRDYKIEATLQERLQQAVANEEYETAAKLRDVLRKRRK
jgi:hypothetical protein